MTAISTTEQIHTVLRTPKTWQPTRIKSCRNLSVVKALSRPEKFYLLRGYNARRPAAQMVVVLHPWIQMTLLPPAASALLVSVPGLGMSTDLSNQAAPTCQVVMPSYLALAWIHVWATTRAPLYLGPTSGAVSWTTTPLGGGQTKLSATRNIERLFDFLHTIRVL